jgi:opacity protein-like surface antigen
LLALGALCASVRADDLAGFYVGAGVGEAHVRTTQEINGDTAYRYAFDAQHSAWQVMAGVRPISPLGVELGYVDFGNPSAGLSNSGFGGVSRAGAKAFTLFGLGYLPLPVPFLDVYGKAGIARLHSTSIDAAPVPLSLPLPLCPLGGGSCGQVPSYSVSDWSTHFALGAGVQGKAGPIAIRAEYELITVSGGGPDMVSLGITWTF